MAAILSRISSSKKPNTKVYNLNPTVYDFSGKKFSDPDLEPELYRKYTIASSTSTINQFHHRRAKSSCPSYSGSASGTSKHKKEFCESGSFENQSMKVLENYSVYKAEETTQKINRCLKVSEKMNESASRLLVNLHQQGEQIKQTHHTAATIDRVLQRGEKLLESLGGLFSRSWKPKKSREIKGPALTEDKSLTTRKGYYMEQGQKLGLSHPGSQSNPRHFRSGSSSALERIELEKAKQDDALSGLSNLLGKLKAMAVDMGSEIDRQHTALHRMQDDVDELNIRMKGANHRARQLLR